MVKFGFLCGFCAPVLQMQIAQYREGAVLRFSLFSFTYDLKEHPSCAAPTPMVWFAQHWSLFLYFEVIALRTG